MEDAIYRSRWPSQRSMFKDQMITLGGWGLLREGSGGSGFRREIRRILC